MRSAVNTVLEAPLRGSFHRAVDLNFPTQRNSSRTPKAAGHKAFEVTALVEEIGVLFSKAAFWLERRDEAPKNE